jgi:CDP-glucose 4,6-dehydratase
MGKDYSLTMEYPLGQRLRELPGPLLLTGHTGFKGTWMTYLLEHLNIPVVGYSLPAERDSLYDRADRIGVIPETYSDIRDRDALEKFMELHKPSTVVHMAAQPLVLESYENPRETFDVNVMGTLNVLDIAFKTGYVKAIIIVTTDKVYKNDNSGKAFVESDPLEGKDPYSASKVGTEAVVAAWQQIASVSGGPRIASVRAGNVIGGGDFARNRLIPDLIRGVMSNNPVEIRNPESTRPWQHVFDPLFGYLLLLTEMINGKAISSLNFGPQGSNLSVAEVTKLTNLVFPSAKEIPSKFHVNKKKEAMTLNLNSSQSLKQLNWSPQFEQTQAILNTLNWWKAYIVDQRSASELCEEEIADFIRKKNDFHK